MGEVSLGHADRGLLMKGFLKDSVRLPFFLVFYHFFPKYVPNAGVFRLADAPN